MEHSTSRHLGGRGTGWNTACRKDAFVSHTPPPQCLSHLVVLVWLAAATYAAWSQCPEYVLYTPETIPYDASRSVRLEVKAAAVTRSILLELGKWNSWHVGEEYIQGSQVPLRDDGLGGAGQANDSIFTLDGLHLDPNLRPSFPVYQWELKGWAPSSPGPIVVSTEAGTFTRDALGVNLLDPKVFPAPDPVHQIAPDGTHLLPQFACFCSTAV